MSETIRCSEGEEEEEERDASIGNFDDGGDQQDFGINLLSGRWLVRGCGRWKERWKGTGVRGYKGTWAQVPSVSPVCPRPRPWTGPPTLRCSCHWGPNLQ